MIRQVRAGGLGPAGLPRDSLHGSSVRVDRVSTRETSLAHLGRFRDGGLGAEMSALHLALDSVFLSADEGLALTHSRISSVSDGRLESCLISPQKEGKDGERGQGSQLRPI